MMSKSVFPALFVCGVVLTGSAFADLATLKIGMAIDGDGSTVSETVLPSPVRVGATKTVSFTIDDTDIVGQLTNGEGRLRFECTIYEANGSGMSRCVGGDPNTNSFAYAFGAVGMARIYLGIVNEHGESVCERLYYVNVIDWPSIDIVSEKGTFGFTETERGLAQTKMTVRLSENPSEEEREFAISVATVDPSSSNPGLLRLGGLTPTVTNANVYTFTMKPGETEMPFYIEESDGTKTSMTRGFVLHVRCIDRTLNPDGIYWDDFFTNGPVYVLIENVAPTLTCDLGDENTNTNPITWVVGDYNPIKWSVSDIPYDLGGAGSSTNLSVVWQSAGRSFSTNISGSSSSYYFTPSFNCAGLTTVSVTVSDKDKDSGYGTDRKTWYFNVWEPFEDKSDLPSWLVIDSIRWELEHVADQRLTANITNVETYAGFREWAESVRMRGGDSAAGSAWVRASPNAWFSYAIASETLVESAPTNGQLKVERFEPTGEADQYDFTVSIEDIQIGNDAAAENLKTVFGIEGGSTIDDLSPTNVTINFSEPTDGKLRFTAGPKNADADAPTFFMKVKTMP